MKTFPKLYFTTPKNCGSALLLAVITLTVLGVLAANQIRNSLTGMRMTEGMIHQNSLLNLAEAGAEFALYSRNRSEWSDWETLRNGSDRVYNSRRFNLGNGNEGEFVVLMRNFDSLSPSIFVESRVFPHERSTPLTRQINIDLSARSLFSMQMLSRNEFSISGGANTRLYSFHSDDLMAAMQSAPFLAGAFPSDFLSLLNSSAFTALFGSFIRDNGSIGSILVSMDAVDIGQADVYGRVATGGEMPNFHDGNARIYGADTPDGVKIDLDRIALDFFATLDPVTIPDFPGIIQYALPDPVDLEEALATNGDNPINEVVDTVIEIGGNLGRGRSGGNSGGGNSGGKERTATVIGTPGGELEVYDLSSVNLDGDLYINGPVAIISRGDFRVGNNELVVTEYGSAQIYFEGDFTLSGNGTVNNETQLARNFVLFGTHTEPGKHTINLNGNAAMAAAVYAPDAKVRFNGGGSRGSFIGSVVAYAIDINGGNLDLVYDETLGDDFILGAMRMDSWRELHRAEDRLNFASLR